MRRRRNAAVDKTSRHLLHWRTHQHAILRHCYPEKVVRTRVADEEELHQAVSKAPKSVPHRSERTLIRKS